MAEKQPLICEYLAAHRQLMQPSRGANSIYRVFEGIAANLTTTVGD